MNKYTTSILILIILVLSSLLIFKPRIEHNNYISLKSKIDTTYIYNSDTIYKNKFIPVVSFQKVPIHYDTAAIIKQYFSTLKYQDTFNEKGVEIIVNEKIDSGKLVNENVIINDTNKIIRDSIFLKERKKFNIYLIGEYNPINKNIGVGLEANYNKLIFGISTDGINVGWRIK